VRRVTGPEADKTIWHFSWNVEQKAMRQALFLGIALFFGFVSTPIGKAQEDTSASMFPFVLPWNDATPGVTDLSSWLDTPAGKHGFIHAERDGHLYAGRRRIRFFGVNFCFGANFPRRDDAESIAARLAKFGINVVRFHHMDMQPFPVAFGPVTANRRENLTRKPWIVSIISLPR